MKPPKLYRKVWLEIEVTCTDEDYDYSEYVGVRRALKPDGSWFWQIEPWYKEDFKDQILGSSDDSPEDWFEYVVYKCPHDFDDRNCGTYNRATIKKKVTTVNPTSEEVDFYSDIPF